MGVMAVAVVAVAAFMAGIVAALVASSISPASAGITSQGPTARPMPPSTAAARRRWPPFHQWPPPPPPPAAAIPMASPWPPPLLTPAQARGVVTEAVLALSAAARVAPPRPAWPNDYLSPRDTTDNGSHWRTGAYVSLPPPPPAQSLDYCVSDWLPSLVAAGDGSGPADGA